VNNVVLSDSDILNMKMILELFYLKQNIGDLTLFSKEATDFMIEYCCTFLLYFIFLYSCTLYDFILNKNKCGKGHIAAHHTQNRGSFGMPI